MVVPLTLVWFIPAGFIKLFNHVPISCCQKANGVGVKSPALVGVLRPPYDPAPGASAGRNIFLLRSTLLLSKFFANAAYQSISVGVRGRSADHRPAVLRTLYSL